MSRLGHILMTRFNVRLGLEAPSPDDAWLRHRLDLFTRYTFQSVRAQVCPPDCWLVFCGPSPEWLRQELCQLKNALPVMELVFVDGLFGPDVASGAAIQYMPAGAEFLITTRIDNDDSIATDYLKAIRDNAANRSSVFLNFTRGVQIANRRLYYRSDPSNAFISLIESVNGSIKTVFVDQHQLLCRYGPIVQIHTHPMWLQVIHDNNLANRARGIRADPGRILSHFNPNLDIDNDTIIAMRYDQTVTALRMTLRVISKPSRIKWLLRTLR